MKVVIIGGVAGGASAAARLRRLDERAEIIMLERGEYISYANCGLPYYIGGEITEKRQLTLQTPERFGQRFNVDVRVQSEAVAIDAQNKTVKVRTKDGTYAESYDKLILSPGAEPILPPIEGIRDERIFTLRTIPDAYRIEEFIKANRAKTAVIVGGGFIGVEMAENLMRLGVAVTIVEVTNHILGTLDYDSACEVQSYLRYKNVRLLLNRAVEAFNAKDESLVVKLNTGETLNADMALICAGVAPDTHLAKSAGLALNARGAIIVDEYLRTSNKDIYAVGDAIEVKHFVSGMPRHIPLAGPANKQGRLVADNICGLQNAYKGTQGSAILKFFDIAAASTGLNEASAKEAGINYDKVHIYSLSHASYYPGAADLYLKVLFQTDNGRILGAQIVGQEGADKRCDVLATAIRANMTIYDLCELELCYAPPFSSAKDPVNMIGFAAENILTGKLKQFHWHEIDRIRQDKNAIILDTRTDYEYRFGAISGAKHIPLDSLRARIKEIDKSKTVYVYCQSGLRSYLASRILIQEGYDCYNLSGGYRLYSTTEKDSLYDPSPLLPCGAKG